MEPMALGSPIGSPNVGAYPTSNTQSGPQFLPGYLMGDVTTQGGSRSFQTSPMKMMKPTPSGYLSVSPPTSTGPTPKLIRLGKTEKPGGPPVQRLFSAPGSSTPKTPSDLNYVVGSTSQASFGLVPQEDHPEHYEESDAGTWVTIFGFPPSAASYILTQAGMWGHILEHKIPSQGNWMHLKFASRLQARKALARNGRLLTDTLMVGVVPCTDAGIVEENRKENVPISSTPSLKGITSPLKGITSPQMWDRSGSFALGTSLTSPSALDRSNLRPLTKSYKGPQADYEVTHQRGTPQQNTSLVSKAMEFVFGW